MVVLLAPCRGAGRWLDEELGASMMAPSWKLQSRAAGWMKKLPFGPMFSLGMKTLLDAVVVMPAVFDDLAVGRFRVEGEANVGGEG